MKIIFLDALSPTVDGLYHAQILIHGKEIYRHADSLTALKTFILTRDQFATSHEVETDMAECLRQLTLGGLENAARNIKETDGIAFWEHLSAL